MTATSDSRPSEAAPPAYEHVDITAAFSKLNLSKDSNFPSKDQTIAHLKLLEAIHLLKEYVTSRDGLYAIQDTFVPDGAGDHEAAKILERVREKRWQVFVCKAVQRFQCWFKTQFQPSAQMCTINDMVKPSYGQIANLAQPLRPAADRLPPLDVLMVWHAFILNPRNYLSDCIRFGLIDLWAGGLPWQAIDSVINNETLAYEPNDDARSQWTALTGSPWDSLEEPDTITVACPKCKRQHKASWTTYTRSEYFQSVPTDYQGEGYADAGFKVACTCGLLIDHDLLRCFKFMTDMQNLMAHNIPMPGGFLNVDGRPTPSGGARLGDRSILDEIFPSRVLKTGELDQTLGNPKDPNVTSPSAIRAVLEEAMTSRLPQIMTKMSPSRTPKLTRGERIAIRKMMACYWDNSSIFSLDLVGAVLRQGIFVGKMHDIDWLHSPALHSTIERLLLKYSRFFRIMADYPKEVAVPTLDVDLAWHTHQLSPKSYFEYSTKTTNNVFIDHDDKIAEPKLNTAFEWTCKTYQNLFKSVYSECTCWYCEATRENTSAHGLKRIFSSTASALEKEVLQLRQTPHDPAKSPHISAHNAIEAKDHFVLRTQERLIKYKLEAGYQRAVAKAKKQGRSPPQRDTTIPYIAYPFWTDSYIVPPACGSFAAGAVGNCAAGTCGGTVSMGSCAGAIGNCVGTSAGGCGGGASLGSVGGGCGGISGGCGGNSGGGSSGGCGGGGISSGCGGGGGGCGGGGGGGGC